MPQIDVPEPFIQSLRLAKSITVLTGAGISAESGIPTFRDSQSGMWAKYDPHDLATPEAFARNPDLVMDWYRWRRDLTAGASPNAGHFALAEMEQRVPGFALITQNVDGLHRKAGSKNIIELHGNLRRLRCSGVFYPSKPLVSSTGKCDYLTEEWPETTTPICPQCGALLRPDVVWFGEALPEQALADARRVSSVCDVFFSIGTSGVVEPAASLPYEALRAGALMVEINPQPTPLNIFSQYEFRQPAGVVLPQILTSAWGGQ